jgi:hypothetical protein
LYFKHRFLGNFDPARIQKELSKSRRQPWIKKIYEKK